MKVEIEIVVIARDKMSAEQRNAGEWLEGKFFEWIVTYSKDGKQIEIEENKLKRS